MHEEELHTICPFCDHHHELITMLIGSVGVPEDGDVTMCIRCGNFCVFDHDARGGLRQPTKKERRVFDRDERLKEVALAWKITRRQ